MTSNIRSAGYGTSTDRRISTGPLYLRTRVHRPRPGDGAAIAAPARLLRGVRGLLRRLRFLRLLVGDARVAVDAGGLAGGELLVLLDRVFRLLRSIHRLRVVTTPAVLGVVGAHLVPLLVGEAPARGFELLLGRD